MIEQKVTEYERDGVVRLARLLSAEEVKTVRREIEAYCHEIAPKLEATEVTFEVGGKAVRNLWRMEKHSRFFDRLAADPKITGLASALVHGEPLLLGVETFNKPPRVGSRVPLHQDNAYFCQTPPDVCTVWIAVDAVTEANGPVVYARGSHKLGLLPHKASGVKGNSMGLAENLEDGNWFAGLLEQGGALVHHCQTIHYSEPNRTDSPRCGLLLVYRGSHTQTDPALQTAYDQARASSQKESHGST